MLARPGLLLLENRHNMSKKRSGLRMLARSAKAIRGWLHGGPRRARSRLLVKKISILSFSFLFSYNNKMKALT